jgi:hypothetical protein
MEPLTIVVSFDVGEQVALGSIACWISDLVNKFGFHGSKVALHGALSQQFPFRLMDWTRPHLDRNTTEPRSSRWRDDPLGMVRSMTSRNRDAPACSRTGNIGKVADFDSAMRRFESSRPSQLLNT